VFSISVPAAMPAAIVGVAHAVAQTAMPRVSAAGRNDDLAVFMTAVFALSS
jgi:hypothetical protein